MASVADFVRESTSTSGTGTLTLTSVDGYARFSDAFNVGDLVYYSIQDSTNRETGIGTVGSGNTLERTTPQVTLVSGVLDDTNPSAISLSGTDCFVYCSSSKDFFSNQTLAAYNNIINTNTVVANFIYDTSNDYNPQWVDEANHQSYLFETLNTSTRGATKKFPRVAGIVAETNKVTIYDLTQASCPMWRVYTVANNNILIGYGNSVSSVTALNGVICIGLDTYGSYLINHITDTAYRYDDYLYIYNGTISDSDNNSGYTSTGGEGLVNRAVNDIAVTQDNTGNNIVAVATDGGVSVIKADGSVVDIVYGGGYASSSVGFFGSTRIIAEIRPGIIVVGDVPNSDISSASNETIASAMNGYTIWNGTTSGVIPLTSGFDGVPFMQVDNYIAQDIGLTHLKENTDTPATGLVAYQTADYATGYLAGDIKGSFMNEAMKNPELVTNGDFSDGLTGWSYNATYWTTSNGLAHLNSVDTTNRPLSLALTLIEGKQYSLSLNIASLSGTITVGITGTGVTEISETTAGNYSVTFEAPSSSETLSIGNTGITTATIDNISVKQLDPIGIPYEIMTTASDAEASDYYGSGVALSEDGLVMAVGSYLEDTTASGAGKVYTYKRDTLGDNWSEVTTTQASDAATNDYYGISVALSEDGLVMVVGAYGETSATGKVYTYKRTTINDSWTEVTTTTASDATTGDFYGRSVSINEDGLVLSVGAHREETSVSDGGKVYSYTRSDINSAWTEQTILQASDVEASDYFGTSCSMSADGLILVVGSGNEDTAGTDTGKVYTYSRQSTASDWSNESMLVASNAGNFDLYGNSVTLSSDGLTLAVGAYTEDTTFGGAGKVYIYKRTDLNSNWVEQSTLQPSDIEASDGFGFGTSLANNGLTLAVGAFAESTAAADAGKVYTYHLGTGNLVSNGTFDLASGWTEQGAGTTLTMVSNELEVTTTGANGAYQDLTVIPNETYTITVDAYTGTATTAQLRIYDDITFTTLLAEDTTTSATSVVLTVTFKPATSIIRLYLRQDTAGTCYWDNIKVIPLTLSGGNLVTNGEDWTGASGTTPPTGWTADGSSTFSVSSGQLTITRSPGNGQITQTINTVSGQAYTVSTSLVSSSGTGNSFKISIDGVTYIETDTNGQHIVEFTATASTAVIAISAANDTSAIITIDNISVQPIERAEHVNYHDFPSWTGDNPDGWTVVNEDASNYVTEHASGARIVSDNTAGVYLRQALTTISGQEYQIVIAKSNHTSGLIRYEIGGAGAANLTGSDANGAYIIPFTATATSTNIDIYRDNTGNTDYVIDSISVKQSQNLVSNGTFHTDTSNWTLDAGDGTFVSSSGEGVLTYGTALTAFKQQLTLEVGQTYLVTFDGRRTASETALLRGSTMGNMSLYITDTTTTTYYHVFTATQAANNLFARIDDAGTVYFDNISVIPLNNQVANGDFSLGLHGWTAQVSSLAVSSGELEVTNSGTNYGRAYQAVNTVIGKDYIVSADIRKGTCTTAYIQAGNTLYGTEYGSESTTSATLVTLTLSFTATTDTTYINCLNSNDSNATGYYDNISVYPAYLDRSVNANNLQIHGQLDVTPVAPGADTLAVSGFSNQNFLQQPYNSDLDFGTGDFYVIFWLKLNTVSGVDVIFQRKDIATTPRVGCYMNNGVLTFYTHNTTESSATGSSLSVDRWYCVVLVRNSSGVKDIYIDGGLDSSTSLTVKDISSVDGTAPLMLGIDSPLANSLDGHISRFRIGAGAPIASDAMFIYNKEKYLYQDNSLSTLQGVSSNIQCMDYDDSTDLLTVCSEDYLDRIQGLRVIESESYGVGDELVTNGDFSDGTTTGWSPVSCSLSNDGGRLRLELTSAANGYAYQTITTEIGKSYVASIYIYTTSPSGGRIRVGNSAGAGELISSDWNGLGSKVVSFTATSTTHYITAQYTGSITVGDFILFDNISVKELDTDSPVTSISTRNGYEIRGN